LSAKYPDNHHLEEKLRQTLQILRDQGSVRFVEPGIYEQTAPSQIETALPLRKGQETTRAELAKLLNQAGDAALRRGMFKPARGPFLNHMFLFHDETNNPYGDVQQGSVVTYVGEGRTGNQDLKRNNFTLANHLETGVQVHYFVQPKGKPGVIRYQGPVFVDEYDEVFRPEEGRSVWQFRLMPADESVPDPLQFYGQTSLEFVDYSRPAGPVQHPIIESMVARKLRTRDFRKRVIEAYRRQCTICGEPLRKGSLDELEAAHVLAVAAGGPHELRNGLALCGRHHWAFDHGFFTVLDNYSTKWLAPSKDPHDEIADGQQLFLPMDAEHRPHPIYLDWHRKQWIDAASSLF
jgi:hypothetical protein